MTIEMLQSFFGWCALINVGLLTWWFLMFWLAHNWIYQFHSSIFKMSVETFDAIHYGGLAAYKIAIFLLNLVPYLVFHLLRGV